MNKNGQGRRKGVGLAGCLNYVFSPIALIALVVGIVGSVYFTCQDVEGKVANVPGYCETRGLEFNILAGYIGVRTPKDGVYDDIACQVYKTDFGIVLDPLKNLKLVPQ